MATGNPQKFLSVHCSSWGSLRKQGIPARACPTALDREPGSWGHPGPKVRQNRAEGPGDHPCCGITGTGPDSPWGAAMGSWAVVRAAGGLGRGQTGLVRPLVPSRP